MASALSEPPEPGVYLPPGMESATARNAAATVATSAKNRYMSTLLETGCSDRLAGT
jgi:hypothetical protein